MMKTMVACFGIGVVAGLRSMTAPAAVAFTSPKLGKSKYLVGALALGELFADKLAATPSRKAFVPFAGRILTGSLSGAALGARDGEPIAGAVAGAVGAVVGTLGGAELRSLLAKTLGDDLPAALIEDVVALGAATVIVSR